MAEPAPSEGDGSEGRRRALADWVKVTTGSKRSALATRLDRWRAANPVLDAGLLVYDRDRQMAGTVVSSALAFRLFLFFVPTVLAGVGLLGFVVSWADAEEINETSGLTGTLAGFVRDALAQSGSARWIAIFTGLFGMATAGRSLAKVLVASSALAWGTELRQKARARVVATVIGLVTALVLMATIVNRLTKESVALGGLGLVSAAAVYGVGWLILARQLPRTTSDPGAGIPGAVLVGVAVGFLQALTQLVLPARISSASSLYGALGGAVAVLGWFFIVGRTMVLSFAVDAVAYERFGSLSRVVFALPVVRVLPRRSPAVRRFFDLDAGDEPDPSAGAADRSDEA
jgi:uncharacterized BrkB/YihY/UPF0761 family membrane protein